MQRISWRLAATATAAALATTGALAPASASRGARTTRVETATYDAPGGVGALSVSVTGTNVGAVMLPAGPERKVSVEVTDATGLPVSAEIKQRGGDGVALESNDTAVPFCGATEKPVTVRPNEPVYVFLYAGPCEDGTPAAATTGEVVATFVGRG
ncbi:MAG TPA: hypothetical protein VEV43_08610 [Actinomycetota bacterium]|nr:hypothetical protein [Actinomycetota bacterium]